MAIVNISIDQLAEVVRNLDDQEKNQIRQVLVEDDYILSPEQENIIMERHEAFERGEMETFNIEELKVRLNYIE